jgi:hypothetical protein
MRSILLLLAPLVMAFAPATPNWEPPRDVQRQLMGGKAWADVLPDTNGAWLVRAAIDIPAPPRTVWGVMTDCRLAARLVITVTSCKILSGNQDNGWDIREQVTRGSMFLPEIHNVLRADYQPYAAIRFHRAGGDLKAEDGQWRIEPLAGGAGSRVIYVNRVAMNLLAPAFMVRAGMKRDVPKVLVNLRRESIAALRA